MGLDSSRAMLDVAQRRASEAGASVTFVEGDMRDFTLGREFGATWYISAPARPDAWVVPMVLRSIFPQELPLLLSAAGLELVARFGELSREPFGPGSRAQVCLCRRL